MQMDTSHTVFFLQMLEAAWVLKSLMVKAAAI